MLLFFFLVYRWEKIHKIITLGKYHYQVARVQGTTVNFAPNYGGTGVFLPPPATVQKCNHFQEKTTQKAATGIFPNHHPQIIAHHMKKNSKLLNLTKKKKSSKN